MSKTIVAIIAIVILEVAAMIMGFNGVGFGLAIGAVAGLGGYEVGVVRTKKRK